MWLISCHAGLSPPRSGFTLIVLLLSRTQGNQLFLTSSVTLTHKKCSVSSFLLWRPVPSSFLFPSFYFLAGGDLLRGNAPLPLPFSHLTWSVGDKHHAKTWSEVGSCKWLRRLRSAFISNGGTDGRRGKFWWTCVRVRGGSHAAGRRACFALDRDGPHLAPRYRVDCSVTDRLAVLPYLDGAVHRVQSLLRQLFQGT